MDASTTPDDTRLPNEVLILIVEHYVAGFCETWEWTRQPYPADPELFLFSRPTEIGQIVPLLQSSKGIKDIALPLLYQAPIFPSLRSFHHFLEYPNPASYRFIRRLSFFYGLQGHPEYLYGMDTVKKELELVHPQRGRWPSVSEGDGVQADKIDLIVGGNGIVPPSAGGLFGPASVVIVKDNAHFYSVFPPFLVGAFPHIRNLIARNWLGTNRLDGLVMSFGSSFGNNETEPEGITIGELVITIDPASLGTLRKRLLVQEDGSPSVRVPYTTEEQALRSIASQGKGTFAWVAVAADKLPHTFSRREDEPERKLVGDPIDDKREVDVVYRRVCAGSCTEKDADQQKAIRKLYQCREVPGQFGDVSDSGED